MHGKVNYGVFCSRRRGYFRQGEMEQAHLQKQQQQQQALNAESLHSAGRVKHRCDILQTFAFIEDLAEPLP